MLQNEHTTDTEKLLQALMSASANSEFMRYGITDEKGNCLTTDGMQYPQCIVCGKQDKGCGR